MLNISEFAENPDHINHIKTTIEVFKPDITILCYCYSYWSPIHSMLESHSHFALKVMHREMQLIKNKKKVELSQIQSKVLRNVMEDKLNQKHVIFYGVEGSGKTTLVIETAKMKLHRYIFENPEFIIRIIILCCTTPSRETNLLKNQIEHEFKSPNDKVQVEARSTETFSSLDDLCTYITDNVKGDEYDNVNKTIIVADELSFTNIENMRTWKALKSLRRNVDLVITISHNQTDHILAILAETDPSFRDDEEKWITNEQDWITCYLGDNFRNSPAIRYFNHLMNSHAEGNDQRKKAKVLPVHYLREFKKDVPLCLAIEDFKEFKKHINTMKTQQPDLKLDNKTMVVYDKDYKGSDLKELKLFCFAEKWKCHDHTEVTGIEAPEVIVYNLSAYNFEVLSRALNKLIIVSTSR